MVTQFVSEFSDCRYLFFSLAQPDPLPNASLRKGSGLVGVSKSQMNSVDALLLT